MIASLKDRFFAKVKKTPTCWEWTGSLTKPTGYGQIWDTDRKIIATHAVLKLIGRHIPVGLDVLHTCDNTKCVNPDHLFFGTKSDNTRDSMRKGRWVIPRGEQAGTHKLTNSIVREIRNLRASGVMAKTLAKRFGVCTDTIRNAAKMRTWAHLK